MHEAGLHPEWDARPLQGTVHTFTAKLPAVARPARFLMTLAVCVHILTHGITRNWFGQSFGEHA